MALKLQPDLFILNKDDLGDNTDKYVYKAMYNGNPVVAKKIVTLLEVNNLFSFQEHKHIVRLIGYVEISNNNNNNNNNDDNHKMFMIMEACDTSLEEIPSEHIMMKSEDTINTELPWMLQVAQALEFVHSKDFRYVDLHPGNILLDEDENVKLCDFEDRVCGVVSYASPESLVGKTVLASDVFAFALVLLELLNGYHPYSAVLNVSKLVPKSTRNTSDDDDDDDESENEHENENENEMQEEEECDNNNNNNNNNGKNENENGNEEEDEDDDDNEDYIQLDNDEANGYISYFNKAKQYSDYLEMDELNIKHIPASILTLAQQCLHFDPDKRPTMKEVVQTLTCYLDLEENEDEEEEEEEDEEN